MAKKTTKVTQQPVVFDEWIKGPAINKKKCVTCNCSKEILECIRAFMRHRIEGKTRKRNYELFDWLKQNMGYKYLPCTLNRHMRECERALYIHMRKADIKYKLVKGPSKVDIILGREINHG